MGSTYSKGLNPLVLIHWAIHSKSNYLPCICVCVFFSSSGFFSLSISVFIDYLNGIGIFPHVHDKMSINYGESNVVYQFLVHSLYVKQFNLTSLYTWDLNCITTFNNSKIIGFVHPSQNPLPWLFYCIFNFLFMLFLLLFNSINDTNTIHTINKWDCMGMELKIAYTRTMMMMIFPS